MSEEDRDDEHLPGPPEEGESELEWIKRQASPELRWLHLFEKLTARVETNEKRVEAYGEESRQRDERIQRNMDFIVAQQAQFAADMRQLRETQESAERRWVRTEESVRALLTIAQSHEGEINALQEAQARLTASQQRTDKQMAETDERISALVNAVEATISGRRNGGGSERREG
jgi:hypothetical protein